MTDSPTYVLLHGDQEVTSQDLTDLVAALIPGYGGLPHTDEGDEAALHARMNAAAAVACRHQMAFFAERGGDDPSLIFDGVSDTDSEILLADKLDVAHLPETWTSPIPLTVLTTSTDTIPSGEVYIYDPATERTFLESLAAHDHIGFLIKA